MTRTRPSRFALPILTAAIVLVTALGLGIATAVGGGERALAASKATLVRSDQPVRTVARLTAASYVAIDAGSGRLLVAHGEHARRPIASLTKMMTALLVIEDGHLRGTVRVTRAATAVEPNKDYLKPGRRYPRQLLLYSALLASNNDAAAALGYDAGGGSLGVFYRRMTARARALGMDDTTYRSASGLNDVSNRSTAYDQAVLARRALREPLFAKVVGTRRKAFPKYGRTYVNHNKMLFSYPGTIGVKTGWTTAAGGCLVTAVQRRGRTVIAVILDSDAIWTDMPRLVKRAFRAYA